MKELKFIFLCTEPSGYLFSSISTLLTQGHRVQIFHYRISRDAPFLIDDEIVNKLYLTEVPRNFSFRILLDQVKFSPEAVIVAGWSNLSYLRLTNYFRKRNILSILMSDTPWYGTVRQKIMSIFLAPAVRLLFKLMWVPGSTQYEYARRLGYANNLILRGLYCADDNLFAERFRDYSLNNKTLIFLGRLVSYKGIELICKAFCEMERSTKEGWKLVVAGNGNNDYLFKTPVDDVIHIPFLQPKEAANLMAEADAFILASDRENWGVTVHEAALSGLVLCLTEGICSSESYLIHGYNGFYIKERSVEGIKETLSKLFSVSDDELKEMKKRSNILGHKYSKELWAATLVGASQRYYY